jgi:Alpha/beta hydrolase of unknown function (DUF1023).
VLVGVAAILAMTSVLGGVGEIAVVPSTVSVSVDIPAAVASSLSGAPTAGSGDSVFGSKAMLGILSQLDPGRITRYVQAHPDAVSSMLASPPAATKVSSGWSALDSREKAALVKGAPGLIGNLDGVPFSVRARANSIGLHRAIADTEQQLKGRLGKGIRLQLMRTLETLRSVRQAATAPEGGAKRSLVIFDVSGETRAAIAIGDLSTAQFVSYLVPGMYFSVEQQVVDWATTADSLYTQQKQWLRRAFGCRSCAGTPGVATVAWIGYQTPALLNVGGLQLANEGSDYLEHALDGIRAVRSGDEPYITVMAHSYGSTAALMTLERHTVSVDALALLGSPGSDAQSAAKLSVKNDNVYVAQAGLDPIVHTAFFGSDPGAASYGAMPMGVGGTIDPFGGAALSASTGHNGYFGADSESMRNLALIGIDQGELVVSGAGQTTQLADGSR